MKRTSWAQQERRLTARAAAWADDPRNPANWGVGAIRGPVVEDKRGRVRRVSLLDEIARAGLLDRSDKGLVEHYVVWAAIRQKAEKHGGMAWDDGGAPRPGPRCLITDESKQAAERMAECEMIVRAHVGAHGLGLMLDLLKGDRTPVQIAFDRGYRRKHRGAIIGDTSSLRDTARRAFSELASAVDALIEEQKRKTPRA